MLYHNFASEIFHTKNFVVDSIRNNIEFYSQKRQIGFLGA